MNRLDVLAHLQRLIRGARQLQIGRQARRQLRQRRVDGVAEVLNLLPGPHLDGQRDAAAATPRVGLVGGVVIIQIPRASGSRG